MILAYDYDSFELKGGTKYFNKAQTIANNAKIPVIPAGQLLPEKE